MKVSYIITTYNRHEMLEQAIGFIAREKCSDSELIVVDDHSIPPVCLPQLAAAAFPHAHKLIQNPVNLGVIGARNAAIQAAKGEFLIFLDDDDESLPLRTNHLLSLIENTPYDFVAACSVLQTQQGEKIVPGGGDFELTANALLYQPPHIDAVIWRKTMFDGTAGLDNRVPYLGEHISMLSCLLNGGRAWLSSAVVARFTYLQAGLTQQAQQQQAITRDLVKMYEILLAEHKSVDFDFLARPMLQMLQKEGVPNFEEYLTRLRHLTIK